MMKKANVKFFVLLVTTFAIPIAHAAPATKSLTLYCDGPVSELFPQGNPANLLVSEPNEGFYAAFSVELNGAEATIRGLVGTHAADNLSDPLILAADGDLENPNKLYFGDLFNHLQIARESLRYEYTSLGDVGADGHQQGEQWQSLGQCSLDAPKI